MTQEVNERIRKLEHDRQQLAGILAFQPEVDAMSTEIKKLRDSQREHFRLAMYRRPV